MSSAKGKAQETITVRLCDYQGLQTYIATLEAEIRRLHAARVEDAKADALAADGGE